MNREIDDAGLVERTRAGDEAAYEVLVHRHYRAAYSIALALLGERADAEDVCQDAFIRALEKIDDCLQPERFAAWLFRIVRNRSHNFRGYEKVRSTKALDGERMAGTADPAKDAERSELGARLSAALATLAETPRQVVLLHDLEGWKHREIGEVLGISEGMSRQHLFVARRRLREILEPRPQEPEEESPGSGTIPQRRAKWDRD